jgi:hypothetical protein
MPGSRKTATAASTTATSTVTPAYTTVTPETVEAWLRGFGLEPLASVEREGITAWDVALDGRRRRDLRATVILDPAIGAIVWAHLAPPIGDGLRKAYRTLLRWNDEFPLAKFSVADDGRPILAVELPTRWLDAGELGLALTRVTVIADAIFDETRGWLWIGGRVPDGYDSRPIRTASLIDEFADRLGELGQIGQLADRVEG